MKVPKSVTVQHAETQLRNQELTQQYLDFLDQHLEELNIGSIDKMLELFDIATILCVSQKQLIKVVKANTGEHPCHFYVQKILEKTKSLLQKTDLPIAEIAIRFTYDPSNFTKFFKKYEGITPSDFRKQIK